MNANNAAQVWPNFTRHAALANDPNHYREYNALIKIYAQNSEFWSASIGAYWNYQSYTNCLFDRVSLGQYGGNLAWYWMRNGTMHGGSLALSEYGQTWPVWIEDSAFDQTSIAVDDNSGGNTNETYCDFNAFVTNCDRLPMHGPHDVIVTNFNWQSSWFGNFYLPTNSPLIDAGSTTAGQLGLAFFTTQTNQMMESNTVVDISYHYVAVNTNGLPFTDTNGVPYYLQSGFDSDGSGLPVWWELLYFGQTGVDPNADPDNDGICNLQEYLTGTDPNDPYSAEAIMLGYWRFNSTNLLSEAGQPPLSSANTLTPSSWSGTSVYLNTNSSLVYPETAPNGNANINCRNGTVRFWFKPHWNSVDIVNTNYQLGNPLLRFIELGDHYDEPSWWALNTGGDL
jgi:hypothetical protein